MKLTRMKRLCCLCFFATLIALWITPRRCEANEGTALGILLSASTAEGLPLGFPPEKINDDSVLCAVPNDVGLVLSYGAMADSDPQSPNRTERLLAEPEIKQLLGKLVQFLASAFQEGFNETDAPQAAGMIALEMIKTVASQPTTIYVRHDRASEQLGGALICHLGDKSPLMRNSIDGFAAMVGPQQMLPLSLDNSSLGNSKAYQLQGTPLPVSVGVLTVEGLGDYLMVGVGEGELESVLQRVIAKKMPAWLMDALDDANVPRRCNLTHIDLDHLAQSIKLPQDMPDEFIALGLDQVLSCTTVTGLDEQATVVSTWVQTGPELGQNLSLLSNPLTPSVLHQAPEDSRVAMATSPDPTEIFDQLMAVMDLMEPFASDEFQNEFRREFGLDFRSQIVRTLGESICIYESPGEGGGLFTGWTAVVTLKDSAGFQKTVEQLLSGFLANERFVQQRSRVHRGQNIDYLHFLRGGPPVSPAWCIQDDKWIVSTYPQGVMAYLDRKENVDHVSAELDSSSDDVFVAVDERAVARLLHPLVLLGITQGGDDFARAMPEEVLRTNQFDVSDIPSLPSIIHHLDKTTVSVRLDDGIRITRKQTLPPFPILPFVLIEEWDDVFEDYFRSIRPKGPLGAKVDLPGPTDPDATVPAAESPIESAVGESSGPKMTSRSTVSDSAAPLAINRVTEAPRLDTSPLAVANAAFGRGDYALAMATYKAVLSEDATNITAKAGVGNCLYELDRYQESESTFDELIKAHPARVEGFLGRGKAKWIQDKNEDALADLKKAVELDPESVDSWLFLALSHQSLNQHEQARRHFADTLRLQPDRWYAHYQRARSSIALNDYDEAIADCTRAIKLNAGDTRAHLRRAEAYENAERLNEAIEDLNTRIDAFPLEIETINKRADLLAAADRPRHALRDYTALIGLNPKDPDAYRNRAGCYMAMESYDQSIQDYLIAAKLDPDQWTYANLAICWESKEDYEKADQYYSAALKLDPQYELALTWRAYARQQLGRYAEAKRDYSAALKAGAEDDVLALGNFSWLLSGCPDDSVRDGKQALELAVKANQISGGSECWIVDNISAAYAELGDFESATRYAKQALTLATTDDEKSEISDQLELYKNKQPARMEEK